MEESMDDRIDLQIKKAKIQLKKDSRIKECFHFDKESCSKQIISAHSLQRNRVLNLIEDEVNGNSSVYSFLHQKYSKEGLPDGFEPLGKKIASTFFGFCGYHDNQIFSPIENYPVDINSDEHCFLLSYRAFARDFHSKYESIQGYKTNEHFKATVDTDLTEGLIEGSEIGLRDSLMVKNRLNDILKNKDFSQLETSIFKLNYMVPLALAASMNPDFSYKNEILNKSQDPNIIYEFVNFVIQPLETGETLILLSCLPEHKKSIKFIDQLDNLKQIPFLKAITSLAISHVENTFFSPKMWEKMTVIEKKQLIYELQVTVPPIRALNKGFFHSKLNLFDPKFKKLNH